MFCCPLHVCQSRHHHAQIASDSHRYVTATTGRLSFSLFFHSLHPRAFFSHRSPFTSQISHLLVFCIYNLQTCKFLSPLQILTLYSLKVPAVLITLKNAVSSRNGYPTQCESWARAKWTKRFRGQLLLRTVTRRCPLSVQLPLHPATTAVSQPQRRRPSRQLRS